MKLIILILMIAAGMGLWFWFLKRGPEDRKNKKNPVYSCPECGEYHCNCYLEKNED